MDSFKLQALAYPGVVTLVSFLAFSSQYLFYYIEPGPLRKGDAYFFNTFIACILICYTRTCFTNPGAVPKDWQEKVQPSRSIDKKAFEGQTKNARYCRRCEQPKPPRSHHCKTCKRCVPKMDHHCVWTANCVSHITFPHFFRFLAYAVISMIYLEYFLYLRVAVLWENRRLPSYLGPSLPQLAHLFVLVVVNSLTLFALSILLGSCIWGMFGNVTTIEKWEIERHEAVLRRAKVMGGYLTGHDGAEIRIERQEYPWDIGFFKNLIQAMDTWNPVMWIFPFSPSPSIRNGLVFEHNGIEDPGKPWPPPDPDRTFRPPKKVDGDGFTQPMDIDSFKQRQAADQQRYMNGEQVVRRLPFHERYKHLAKQQQSSQEELNYDSDSEELEPATRPDEGEEAWRTKEGERLADFGVDEDIEFYDEDDLPLSELLRRRKLAQ